MLRFSKFKQGAHTNKHSRKIAARPKAGRHYVHPKKKKRSLEGITFVSRKVFTSNYKRRDGGDFYGGGQGRQSRRTGGFRDRRTGGFRDSWSRDQNNYRNNSYPEKTAGRPRLNRRKKAKKKSIGFWKSNRDDNQSSSSGESSDLNISKEDSESKSYQNGEANIELSQSTASVAKAKVESRPSMLLLKKPAAHDTVPPNPQSSTQSLLSKNPQSCSTLVSAEKSSRSSLLLKSSGIVDTAVQKVEESGSSLLLSPSATDDIIPPNTRKKRPSLMCRKRAAVETLAEKVVKPSASLLVRPVKTAGIVDTAVQKVKKSGSSLLSTNDDIVTPNTRKKRPSLMCRKRVAVETLAEKVVKTSSSLLARPVKKAKVETNYTRKKNKKRKRKDLEQEEAVPEEEFGDSFLKLVDNDEDELSLSEESVEEDRIYTMEELLDDKELQKKILTRKQRKKLGILKARRNARNKKLKSKAM